MSIAHSKRPKIYKWNGFVQTFSYFFEPKIFNISLKTI